MPGRAIGAGIEQLGAGVAEAVTAVDQRHKEEAKQGKAAEVFYQAIPEDQRPMDLQAFKNLAAKDKVATMRGLVEGQGYRKGAEDILSKLASRSYVQTQEKLMKSQLGEIGRQRGLESERAARLDLLNEDLRNRLTLPEGEQGPLPALDSQAAIQMLAKHGLLMDPQTDNLVQSLARASQRSPSQTALGVPGTITPVPGKPGSGFLWMTPQSGKEIEMGTDSKASEPPPGYTTWTDERGRTKLVKPVQDQKLNPANEARLLNLTSDRVKLEKLMNLKAMGATKYVDTGGDPIEASWYNLFNAADLNEGIQKLTQSIADSERRLEALKIDAGSTAKPSQTPGAWEGYQKWKERGK